MKFANLTRGGDDVHGMETTVVFAAKGYRELSRTANASLVFPPSVVSIRPTHSRRSGVLLQQLRLSLWFARLTSALPFRYQKSGDG